MNVIKILLATLSIEPSSRFENSPNGAYSLGLAYINSFLEKEGHEVKLLFLNNFSEEHSEEAFFRCVEEFQPQVVGFQIFSMNRTSTFHAIEKMEQNYSHIRIIIGGVHTSAMYDQIIRKYQSVVAAIGEGEYIIADLVKSFECNTSLESISGISYFKEGHVVQNNPRDLIADLDSLPFPKHSVFFDDEPERVVGHIITSRGCPFNCSFCCLKVISQRKYRKRNITSVVEEIKYLKERYPRLQHIQIHDDTFLLDNERVIEFCKLVIDANLSITFTCSARVKPISSEMFSWMEKAGFEKIMFGLETGSEKLLDSIHKNITKKDVITLFETLKPFNFVVTTFLMCGFPGEDDATIQETIELVQKTQKIYYNWIAGIGKLWVYPGTEVYELMKEAGCIDDDFWLSEESVPYYTVEHSLDELIEYENTILDHVSIFRILTFNGFKNQFLKMPLPIIRFLLHKNTLLSVAVGYIYLNYPNCYKRIQKIRLLR